MLSVCKAPRVVWKLRDSTSGRQHGRSSCVCHSHRCSRHLPEGIRITTATPEEYQACSLLLYTYMSGMDTARFTPAVLQPAVATASATALTARHLEDAECVGYLWLGRFAATRRGGWSASAFVVVDPDWRCQGVGTALLREGEKEAQRQGCGAVEVYCASEDQAAVQWFTKQGYSLIQSPRTPVLLDTQSEDEESVAAAVTRFTWLDKPLCLPPGAQTEPVNNAVGFSTRSSAVRPSTGPKQGQAKAR